ALFGGVGRPEIVVFGSFYLAGFVNEKPLVKLRDDLAALGYDPSTVRRAFKREFGVTFLEMARLRRLGQVAERLSSGARV
ncbi:molecular chaperone TorD family protein, partial [Acinetobacter baumannii]